jgi:hypothetical protein
MTGKGYSDFPEVPEWQIAGDPEPPPPPPPLPPTWQPQPLTAYGAAVAPTAGTLPVQGGRGLLYPGRTHSVYGEPGSGKSWFLVAAVVATLQSHPTAWALLVDLEDVAELWVARFLQVGVPPVELGRIAYTRPREPVIWDGLPWLVENGPALVALDGLTEFYAVNGLDSWSADDTARVMRHLDRLTDTGAALLLADHVTKARDQRRFASGSQHKLAALTGAAYLIEPTAEPIRRGHNGASRITLTKDRPGGIPSRVGRDGRDAEAATLTLDDTRRPARLTVRPGRDWG